MVESRPSLLGKSFAYAKWLTLLGLITACSFLEMKKATSDISVSRNTTKEKILFLIASHKEPSSSARIQDMILRYKRSLTSHPNIDLKFVWTNNFQGTSFNVDIDGSTMVFTADEAKQFKNECSYCKSNKPWNWSNYAALVLATRKLQQEGIIHDKVWFIEPDAEFVGELGDWIKNATNRYHELDLVASLVVRNVETAKDLLSTASMYTRIKSDWRWNEQHGADISYGAFTQVAMFSARLIEAIGQNLNEAGYVETFVPFVCENLVPFCKVGSLSIHDVGFINNGGNEFSGEESAANFRDIARTASDQWFHPVKFDESWMTDEKEEQEHLDSQGLCATMDCTFTVCDEVNRMVDNCLYKIAVGA